MQEAQQFWWNNERFEGSTMGLKEVCIHIHLHIHTHIHTYYNIHIYIYIYTHTHIRALRAHPLEVFGSWQRSGIDAKLVWGLQISDSTELAHGLGYRV